MMLPVDAVLASGGVEKDMMLQRKEVYIDSSLGMHLSCGRIAECVWELIPSIEKSMQF